MGVDQNINNQETIERSSITSIDHKLILKSANNDNYNNIKTPKDECDIEGGALREGGAPNLYSFENIGLLANYAAVGIVYGAFPRTVYPFLNNYLNMDGYQALAAQTLILLPWSFKTFIGIITDSFPIFGYRRRPYMVLGWGLCFFILLIMAILPVDDPYYSDRDLSKLSQADLDILYNQDPTLLNLHAPESGSKYILLMMLAAIGYIVADVAADAVVVEYAQREPENIRGTTQTMIYFTRTVFQILSTAMIGFLMNGKEYGGQFTFSLQFSEVMAIFCVACALVIPASIFCLQEKKVEKESFKLRCNQMWQIVQNRAVWQLMAYKFFSGIFQHFQATPTNIIQREWARVQPLNDSIFSIVGLLAMAATLFITKQYGLNWDWRITIAVTTILTIIIDFVVSFVTIFDVFRNEWFWLGVPILEELPYGIRFIISTYVVVEIAEEGYEGATYGLLTTISNLSIPFAASISKQVDSYFDAFLDDIKRDDNSARWAVAWTFIIMYIAKILSIPWLVLLPRQKKEAQELKRNGGKSKIAGAISLFVAAFALIWSIVTNLMSIFPETSCYKIAGGEGC